MIYTVRFTVLWDFFNNNVSLRMTQTKNTLKEEVPIVEVPTQLKIRVRSPKAAKRALEEEETLDEENLVETLSQRPKRLKK